jgi:hypothetical protein
MISFRSMNSKRFTNLCILGVESTNYATGEYISITYTWFCISLNFQYNWNLS